MLGAGGAVGMSKISLERWNEGLLRPYERPALAWLAARLPCWVSPNLLTGIGVAGALVTACAYAFSGSHPALLWLATLGFAINWFGDSLDGTVARLRRIERPRYGYYLDNAVDCFLVLPVAIGLGLSGYVRLDVCLLAAAIYSMISALTFLRANVTDIFQISYGGAGPTEMRAAAALLNTAIFFTHPAPFALFGVALKYPDVVALVWCCSGVMTFLVSMAAQARQLAIDEPVRQQANQLEMAAVLASDPGDNAGAFVLGQTRGA